MERFSCDTQIVAGPGAVNELGKLNIRRLLLVTDPYFADNGEAARVAGLAHAQAVEVFSKVRPDPTVELVAEGTAAVKEFKPDGVVALGGGSAMDCAKAMLWFSGLEARLIAIPTTSGSGSEVTDFAVVTHGTLKYPLVDQKLQPCMAILDSDLLENLPRRLIADAGFDVMAHALEAYVAKNAGAVSDALARDAFCAAFAHLPASYSGKLEVRGRIHTAATMAGMAFSQAGLGLCHAFAHCLGGMFHVPHGRLNAILLPAVVLLNAQYAPGKYAQLARSAGLGGSADTVAIRNLKNGLIRLRKELNMPQTLAQAGVEPRSVQRAVPEIVKAVKADPCFETNPFKPEDFMLRRLLEEVTGRV